MIVITNGRGKEGWKMAYNVIFDYSFKILPYAALPL